MLDTLVSAQHQLLPMFHRRPAALNQLSQSTSVSLARLAALEGFSRSMLVGIVPLVAYQALGSKENVARVYLVAAIFTLFITLNFGTLERWLQRRWVLSLGCGFLMLAALSLWLANSTTLPLGIGLRSAAASLFSVSMSLYIMDYIGKRDLTRNESRRMQYSGAAWLAGPMLGTWLLNNDHSLLPFLLSAVSALLALGYFWTMRLGDNKVFVKAQSSASNPFVSVKHFAGQRRLRIAYGITLSRSCFWVALFIYGPIYVVESGLPTWFAGVLLSGVSALLFFSPLIRAFSERIGIRQLVVSGLVLTGGSLAALGLIGEAQPFGVVFWVTGALGGVLLDVLGNIPFMRMVRPRERTAMTTVFSTWREASELLTPAIVGIILLWLDFHYFFFVLAFMHFLSAASAARLPRRL